MPRLGGRRLPVVLATVGVVHRCIDQCRWLDVIEASQAHTVELPAEHIQIAASERTHAAMPAEQVVHAV
jgi:hypothetical protein